MSAQNPLWGSYRIHGELLKLGIDVSEGTVKKYMGRRERTPPCPGWLAFLRNQIDHTVAVDMFVVITVTFHLLYAVVFMHHGRRKIIHCNVTAHPTQEWLTGQMVAAFRCNQKPEFLLRDRDSAYGRKFRECVKAMGVQEIVTSPQSPWQNAYIERAIGSIRRECLNHVIVFNERHLKGVLTSYIRYYNGTRTHWSPGKDAPDARPVDPPSAGKTIIAIPQVGGLHHRYERRAT